MTTQAEGTGDIAEDLGLPADTNLKWTLVAALKAVMRDHWTVADLAKASLTEPETLQAWLHGQVRNVKLGELIYVYDIAAKAAGTPTIAQIVRAYVQIMVDLE